MRPLAVSGLRPWCHLPRRGRALPRRPRIRKALTQVRAAEVRGDHSRAVPGTAARAAAHRPVPASERRQHAMNMDRYHHDHAAILEQIDTLRSLSRAGVRDRKSTRLNSSHVKISYAVFCLKKKKEQKNRRE